MKEIKISIITVNYKVKESLIDLIQSIKESVKNISYEIIVIDNEGDKSFKKKLEKYENVRYIRSPKNLGFGRGNNLGAKHAKGEYLFFLNPDTLVSNDAIEQLYRFIKSKKNIGIVSPLLVDTKLMPFSTQSRKELTPLNAIYSFSFLRKFFPKKSIYNDVFFKTWDKKQPIEVETIPGAALMIQKDLFEKAGSFDEKFFLYFEENDLSNRVRKLGYELFIIPESKIIHKVGQSTKNLENIENIYKKSRFLYFRKHYGLFKSLLLEIILGINKYSLAVFLILLTALFLRTVNLQISMPFIGDQGWFYLSARDLLMEGKIPLVGITSSHTWLHQGPLWTYMLSVALFLGNFNPLAGGFLTAAFGVGSVFLMYRLGSELFSQRIGLIAASLYAVSPLIVFFDRMPFDPSPIPFFTILYFYSIFKWIKGKNVYFPLTIVFLAILYNLELATFSLFFPLFFIFLYGIYRKKSWIRNILNKKIIFYSIIGFSTVMAPIIVYDFANGFKQTIVFLGWVFIYKPFSFLFKHTQDGVNSGIAVVVKFLAQNTQKIVFEANLFLALFLFSSSVIIIVKDLLKKNNFNLENPKLLLLIFMLISVGGILINKSPSDAYLPIVFPFVIFSVSIFFDQLLNLRKIKYIAIAGIFILLSFNFYSAYKNTFNPDLKNRIIAAEKIIVLSKGREYNLIGEGNGSQFKSFTMNYEYLLWWKGYPPSNNPENIKIYISEDSQGIHVNRNQ